MIIWRGWGFPLLFLLVGPMLVLQSAVMAAAGRATFESNLFLWNGLGIAIGGLLTLLVRIRFLQSEPRELVDVKTGRSIIVRSHHDIFWIDIKWWSIAALVGGVASMIWGLVVPTGRI
jgi:hypothetical protein